MRTALVVSPQTGTLPPLTPEAQKRRADAAALAKTRDHQTGVQIFGNLYTVASWGSEPYHSSGVASQGPPKRRRRA